MKPTSRNCSPRQLLSLKRRLAALERDNKQLRGAAEQTLARLQEAEAMCNHAPIGFMAVDPQGFILAANATGAQMLGQKIAAVIGKSLRRFISGADRLAFMKLLKRAFQARSKASCELTLLAKGARPTQVRLDLSVRNASRECHAFLTDITGYKNTESELRASESLLRAAFENAPVEFWVRDRDQVGVMENARIVKHWGSILGKRPEQGPVSGAVRSLWLSNNRRALGGEIVKEEVELHEPGGTRWMHNVIAPFSVAGEIRGILGFNVDITERMLSENLLREQLAQIDAIYQTAPLGLCLLDTEFRYLRVNEALAGLNGMPVERHLGRTVREIVPRAADFVEKLCRRVIETREPVLNLEISGGMVTECFSQRTWLSHWVPITLADGRLIGVNVMVQEVTERKRSEQALREARDHLEARVRERTAELERVNAALCETQQTLQAIYDSSPLHMGVAELRGESAAVLSGNAAMTNFFGHPPHRMRSVRNRAPAALRRAWVAAYRQCLKQGAPVHFDFEYPVANGKRWFSATVALLSKSHPNPPRFSFFAEDITHRKAAESRLHEALELNRSMVASSAVGIAAYNAAGDCVFANPALARITGVTVHDLLLQNFRQLESFNSSVLRRMAERALAEKRPQDCELYTVSSAGKEVWAHCHEIPFLFNDAPHLLHMVHDISEQKRAERFLITQRDLAVFLSQTHDLQAALDRLMDAALQIPGIDCAGVHIADSETGGFSLRAHRGLSRGFVEATSVYPADSLQVTRLRRGKPLYQLQRKASRRLAKLLKSENITGLAVLPLIHQGVLVGSFNFASHQVADFAPGSRTAIESLAALVVGAIARIQTEAARVESERRLRTIIENTPIVVFSGNREGVITYEEGRALKEFGLKRGQHIGRRTLEAYAGSPMIAETFNRLQAGHEVSTLLQFGSNTFETWYTPVRDDTGNISGYFGIATDVTERVRLERQIIEISDRVQANFGQEIHDGLCQVLVGAAFDANSLRERLTGIPAPEQSLLVRLCGVLDDAITDARRLSRGLFPVKLEKYGLTAALKDFTESLGRHSGMRTRFAELGGPVLVGNNIAATHLFRIAQEAMTNAAKHSRARHLSVKLELQRGELALAVADDGEGIQAEARSGPGLGLHIMSYRARAIGGSLQIRPRRGAGTLVLCRLPLPQAGSSAVAVEVGS